MGAQGAGWKLRLARAELGLSEAFELSRRADLPELFGRIAGVRRRCLAGRESEPAVRRLDEQLLAR